MNRIIIEYDERYKVEDMFFYVVSAYRRFGKTKDNNLDIVKRFNDEVGTNIRIKKVGNDYKFEISSRKGKPKLLKEEK